MNTCLTKDQVHEFMVRQDKQTRRPPISQDQMRCELGADLIEQQRAERDRRLIAHL